MTLQDMISKRLKPQEERQFHAAWLAKLGVPAQFRDAIVDHMPPNGRIKLIVYLLVWPIGFLAAIFVFVGLLTPLDALITVRAAAVAAETGASLIHVDAGLSALVMVFGLVALMGWVRAAMLARRRTSGFPTGAAAMLNPPPRCSLPICGGCCGSGCWSPRLSAAWRSASWPVRSGGRP
jgi:hypothetical protein